MLVRGRALARAGVVSLCAVVAFVSAIVSGVSGCGHELDVEVEAEEVRKLEDEEDSATPRVIKVKVPKVREKFTDSSSIFRRDSGKSRKWASTFFHSCAAIGQRPRDCSSSFPFCSFLLLKEFKWKKVFPVEVTKWGL